MYILRRSLLEQLAAAGKVCPAGLARHGERAAEQQGQDFGDGAIGNGVDTYYPNGIDDAEYERIAEHDAQHAMWLINHRAALGTPLPSRETFAAVASKLKAQATRRRTP